MACMGMKDGLLGAALAVGIWVALPTVVSAQDSAKDWPMYNHDVLGTRHNRGETAIDKSNAGRLEEKWRFPAKGSDLEIGAIHATPTVVDGSVYFGTISNPTFYKLSPDGKLARPDAPARDERLRKARFLSLEGGIFTSALVTKDSVFFGDLEGWFIALDRETGKERWKINTRAKEFPGPKHES